MIDGWKFEAEGKVYDLDLSDIDGLEAREFRQVVGVPLSTLDDALASGRLDTIEALAAVRWLLDRRDNPDLRYVDVLKVSTYEMYKSVARDAEGDASPPVETAVEESTAGSSGDIQHQTVGAGPSN